MEPEDFLILECPACERSVKIRASLAGTRMGCPYCKEPIDVVDGEADEDLANESEAEEPAPLEFRKMESSPVPSPQPGETAKGSESGHSDGGERRRKRKRNTAELVAWDQEKSEEENGEAGHDDDDSSEFLEMDPNSPGGVRMKRVRRKKILTKKDKFIRFVTAGTIVAAVGIAGLIIYSALVQGAKVITKDFDAPEISPELRALIDEAKRNPISPELTMSDENLAKATLIAFLKAKTIEERALYVRNPEVTKTWMTQWYAENPEEAKKEWPEPEILKRKKIQLPDGRYFIVFRAEFGSAGSKVLALEQRDNAGDIKLDWATTVGYQPIPLERFKESKPRTPTTFWVKVQLADFYNFQFSDKERYQSVELRYPGKVDFKLIGYIDRQRQWAPALLGLLEIGQGPSLIVQVKYPDGEIRDPSLVEIVSILENNWWPSAEK